MTGFSGLAWVEGAVLPMAEARVPVTDRSFLYADSIYDTVRTYGRRPFLPGDHVDRLRRSGAELGLPVPWDDEELFGIVDSLMAAWPDARFGGMNVEAGVLLSNRARLQEIENVEERAAEFERLVADSYDRISAMQTATRFGFDDVIDPAKTRDKILKGLASVPNSEPLRRGRGQFIDTW